MIDPFTFIILNILASSMSLLVGYFTTSFFKPMFRMFGAILFFSLALIMMGSDDIGMENPGSTISHAYPNGTVYEVETLTGNPVYWVGDGDPDTNEKQWLGWIYMGLAFFTLVLFFNGVMGNKLF